ncbi:MAG: hypothetical protein AB7L65_11110, partial [Hyphomonadaceae bacterium]
FALAACASTGGAPRDVNGGAGRIPQSAIALGDYRRAIAAQVAQRFSSEISGRYGQSVNLADARSDLTRNQFACMAPPASQRGDPPAQVCRRILAEAGCTHTWQVHLYGGPALARTRALYDRACGDDGLLGGPS